MLLIVGKREMEEREPERQSRSLMACKVISCGLVKLKAASLGCNSWQSCPPFTLTNPSFRAFSHNPRFMEKGRKEESDDGREICNHAQDEKKFKCQPRRRQDWGLRWRLRALWARFGRAAERITSLNLPSRKARLNNCSSRKHGSRATLIRPMWSLLALHAEIDRQNFLSDPCLAGASPPQNQNVLSPGPLILTSVYRKVRTPEVSLLNHPLPSSSLNINIKNTLCTVLWFVFEASLTAWMHLIFCNLQYSAKVSGHHHLYVPIHIYLSEVLLRRNQKIKEMLNVEKTNHSAGNSACVEFFG